MAKSIYIYDGKSLGQWAKTLGIGVGLLHWRMKRSSLREAIEYYESTSVRVKRTEEYMGKSMSNWAKELGISQPSLSCMCDTQGSLEKAVEYYQEGACKSTLTIAHRSPLLHIRKVEDAVYLGVCPVCTKRLLIFQQEAVEFQHSEKFCCAHEWEERKSLD